MSIRKFLHQTLVLTSKNIKLSFRNFSATLSQLWIGVIFLFLLLIIGAAIQATSLNDTTYTDVKIHKDQVAVSFFPPCVPGSLPCYNFAYASSQGLVARNSSQIERMVTSIALKLNISTQRNVSGGIFAFGEASTSADVNSWLLQNPNSTRSVFIFENSHQWEDASVPIRFVYRSNSSRYCAAIRVYKCDNPWLTYHTPMLAAMHSSVISIFGGEDDNSIRIGFTNIPHPDLPATFNSMKEFGTLFMYIALTFNYVILLSTIVREKELHLVESMKQMGMQNAAYWSSWICSATVTNTIMVFLLMAFGNILQFELFAKTSSLLLITILWLSAQSFTGLALVFSTLIRTTASARIIGVMVFIITFIASPLLYSAFFLDPSETYNVARVVISIFPFFSYYYAMETVIQKTAGSLQLGVTWEDRTLNQLPASALNVQPTFWSIESSLSWLAGSFFLFVALAYYLEQVIPNEHGRRKSACFCFSRFFIFLNKKKQTENTILPPTFDSHVDEDVQQEAKRIFGVKTGDENLAVVMYGTSKYFGKFKAVDQVFYGIPHGQLCAILGHNGSGKSTTFNLLTGSSSVTSGDAFIFGQSVTGDTSAIRARMGVCPQHDVLWEQLTAQEHLELFAVLKDVKAVKQEALKRLEQVKLVSATNKRAGGFSGGMKRRLSIAIAMLGDPAIVFLDEPTTGMDPVTRRDVLNMISESKSPDRVIVLTSHAMEEVEMLADKVVLMSRGRIQAVGTVTRLKKRFGLGYKMTMFGSTKAQLEAYFTPKVSKCKVEQDGTDALLVSLPQATAADLVPLFTQFELDKSTLGVEDFSLSLSTLEEVFLNLSSSEEEREMETLAKRNPNWLKRMEECDAYQPKFNAQTKVTLVAQANALFWKSFTFQLRNCSSCVCVILFPVLIMCMLIALEAVLFQPLKMDIVCGKNVTRQDCNTTGPDLTCVAKLFEFREISKLDTVKVGEINFFDTRGNAANANCNSDVCYAGLEKLDARNLSLSFSDVETQVNVGSVKIENNEALLTWHANLLFLLDLSQTTCQAEFDKAFDCDANLANKTECLNDVRELQQAKEYSDAKKAQQTSSTFGLGSCSRSATGELKIPSQVYLDRITVLNTELNQCTLLFRQTRLLPHFQSTNVSLLLSQAEIETSGVFMSKFNLQRFIQPEIQTLTLDLWKFVNEQGPIEFGSNTTYFGLVYTWALAKGLDSTDFQFIPTIAEMCQAKVGASTFVFRNQIETYFFNNQAQVDALCVAMENLDVLRGFSTVDFDTREALDLHVYKTWFGTEVETALMANYSFVGEQVYRQRQFLSTPTHVHFFTLTELAMDVILYANKTAGGNAVITNWPPLVANVLQAYVESTVSRRVEMRSQEIALKFQCNREEWLSSNFATSLDCDMLPILLQVSVIDFVAINLFPFLFFIFAFLVVNQLVYEKEEKLRVIMRMNGGLKNMAYWGIAFGFFFAQFLCMSLAIYILGNIAKLKFTSLHDWQVYWAFIISWGPLMIVFSFLLSIFFSSSQSSTAGVFLFVLIVNLIGIQLIYNVISDPLTTEQDYASLMWLPPFAMIRYIIWLGLAGGLGEKISYEEMRTFGDNALSNTLNIMWYEFLVCVLLVWYLDNVYVAGFGTRKPLLFFLQSNYWTGKRQGNAQLLKDFPEVSENLTTQNNADVLQEYLRVCDETVAGICVRICRLHKEFDNGFVAVKSLSLGINENECFGLLGHNGAGKTTAISMLVGLFEPTSGTALVDGLSINTDMEAVQTRMGVTPQHDLCWGPLSVRDHLLFYARLKGVPRLELNLAVDKALFDVNLKQFEHRASAKLSGGMRRRLSTAMSLIGTPRIVYLDEPSTGLDPASKRALWKVIAKAKGNKSLVLTTHSLEEAEALCDRIGIMALGELQCLGTASQLKKRYGAGYTFFVAVQPNGGNVIDFTESMFGRENCKVLGRVIGGTFKFEVKREAVVLSKVFQTMESAEVKEKLALLDWSLTETTLEEVFLKLADMAHVDEVLSSAEVVVKRRRWCFKPSTTASSTLANKEVQVQDKV